MSQEVGQSAAAAKRKFFPLQAVTLFSELSAPLLPVRTSVLQLPICVSLICLEKKTTTCE